MIDKETTELTPQMSETEKKSALETVVEGGFAATTQTVNVDMSPIGTALEGFGTNLKAGFSELKEILTNNQKARVAPPNTERTEHPDVNFIVPKAATYTKSWDGSDGGLVDVARDHGLDTFNPQFRAPIIVDTGLPGAKREALADPVFKAASWLVVKKLVLESEGMQPEIERLGEHTIRPVFKGLTSNATPGSTAITDIFTNEMYRLIDLQNEILSMITIKTYGPGEKVYWNIEKSLPTMSPLLQGEKSAITSVDFGKDNFERKFRAGILNFNEWFSDETYLSPMTELVNWLVRATAIMMIREIAIGDPAKGEMTGLLNTTLEVAKDYKLDAALDKTNIMKPEENLFNQFDDDGAGQQLEDLFVWMGHPAFKRALKKFYRSDITQKYVEADSKYCDLPVYTNPYVPKDDVTLEGVAYIMIPKYYQVARFSNIEFTIDRSAEDAFRKLETNVLAKIKIDGKYTSGKYIGRVKNIKSLS